MYIFAVRAVFSFIISFLTTWYCIPIFIRIAYRFKILDIPDGKIKQHKTPTPYLGGLAVYVGFITVLAVIFPFYNVMFNFLLGVTILLFIGLIDDLIAIKPYQKLFGQMIAVLCFFKAGFYLKENFFLNNIWRIPLSMVWILTIINAYNLVDVMDGLATSLAIGAATSFLCIALLGFAQPDVILLLLAFIGPLCAFFWYNKPPAAMYLGDTGSLFIGGFLSVIPFLFDWGKYNLYGLIAPLIILAIPLLEVGMLIVIRSYKKIPFYNGSPHHFSMYLQKKGWSRGNILLAMAISNCILIFGAILVVFSTIPLAYILLFGALFLVAWSKIIFF